jgi:hypothetical protein
MKILNELIEEGYVKETGYAASSGGRRPLMYTINPDTLYIYYLLQWTSWLLASP